MTGMSQQTNQKKGQNRCCIVFCVYRFKERGVTNTTGWLTLLSAPTAGAVTCVCNMLISLLEP